MDTTDPAWPEVRQLLLDGRNSVEIVPAQRDRGERALVALQMTSRTALGAVALETAVVRIDHGWLRLLGAGGLAGGLLEWNGLSGEPSPDPPLHGALVVAHDVAGGVYALNGGAFADGRPGDVHFFAPDTLRWEPMGIGYSRFIGWLADGDLATFYEPMRWPGWQPEVEALTSDEGVSIYPFPVTAGPPTGQRARRAVPMRELWTMYRELAAELEHAPDGATLRVTVDEE